MNCWAVNCFAMVLRCYGIRTSKNSSQRCFRSADLSCHLTGSTGILSSHNGICRFQRETNPELSGAGGTMKIKDKSLRLQIFDIPTNKNRLRSLTHKSYFSKLKRLRIDFDWAVLEAKKKAGFPLDFHEPPKKLSVKIVIYKKQRGGRLPDSVNYLSELLDALVRLGVLHDDRDKWFKLESIGIERGKENMTEIKLEET